MNPSIKIACRAISKKLMLAIVLLCVVSGVKAQLTVTGKLLDAKSTPIPKASVTAKASHKTSITDANGKFTFTGIQANDTLQCNVVGFQKAEIPVNGKTSLVITLTELPNNLDEIVVVGYGTQKRSSVTGSIATVKSEQLTAAPFSNVTNALAGRLPGLVVKQESGLPGRDAASLSIRGFESALIIIDGVEANLSELDANEIESVSILKDASAAIYGSRAGNGVILVTTKKGLLAKPTITFNSTFTLQGNLIPIKPMSSGQLTEIERETHLNSGKPLSTVPWTEEEIAKFYAGGNPDYPNTNWFKVLARDWTPQQQHNLSIRGGTDKINFLTFLGYTGQESMFKKNGGDYKRFNFRSNLNVRVLDNLSAQLNVAYIVGNRNFPNRKYEDGYVWADLWNARAYYPSELPDPNKIPYTGSSGVNAFTNTALSGYDRDDSKRFNGSLSMVYRFLPIPGLYAKGLVNYNQGSNLNKNFQKPFKYWVYFNSTDTYVEQGGISLNQLTQTFTRDQVITGQFSLNYERNFNKMHQVTALALYEIIDYKNDMMTASRSDFVSNEIDYLFAGSETTQLNNGNASQMGRASFVGRLNYGFKHKYLLESTVRYDASAKLAPGHRWGLFPSVSLGWRLSNESFIRNNVKKIDDLKLRLSYSQTGNDAVNNFQYLSGYWFGADSRYVNYVIGGSTRKALLSTGLANPYLSWEQMTIYNVGLDFSFWNKKLYGTLDAFYRNRKGIPATKATSLPTTFGSLLPPENINSMSNRGFEIELGHTNKIKGFTYDVSANISYTRAKWGHYEEPVYTDPDEIRINKKSGTWVNRTFGFVSDGLFTSKDEIQKHPFNQDQQGNTTLNPGDVKYKDTNGDGKLDWRDQVEIGRGTRPDWMMGINANMSYKNFDLALLFQGAFGFVNNIVINGYPEVIYKERWTVTNNNADAIFPRLGGAATNAYFSNYRLKNADYLRLKSLTVGYTLSKAMTGKVKISSVRFFAAGTNLLTFDGLKKYGIDPEAPSGSSNFYYPQQRTITLGVNVVL